MTKSAGGATILLKLGFNFKKEKAEMGNTLNNFRAHLAGRGLRLTNQRRLILQEILSRREHFEPEDLAYKLRSKGVSRTSIYRTLPLLAEAGIIRKTPCDLMKARYECVSENEHHDHLVCNRCGKITEFCDNEIENLQKRVAKKYGFEMTGHRLIISGLCSKCRKQNSGR